MLTPICLHPRIQTGNRLALALALALVLARRPSVLLLDEPLADLDPLARLEVQQTLMTEVLDTGMTVLLSSHIRGESRTPSHRHRHRQGQHQRGRTPMTRASSHGRPLRDVPHPAGTDPAAGGGKAPGGMWWVAWRQHRAQLAISLGLLVALALAWVVFRLALVSRLAELTGGDDTRCASIEPPNGPSSDYCPEQAYDAVQAEFGIMWGLLRLGMLALPLVLGAFVGAPLFAREFEQTPRCMCSPNRSAGCAGGPPKSPSSQSRWCSE